MTHARLSPSASARWIACPGSVREEAKYPESRGSAAAVDGTHSHTLLEHCIKQQLADPMLFVGTPLEDHDGQFVVTAEQAARVNIAVQYIRRRMDEIGQPVVVHSEKQVDAGTWIGRSDMAGTADVQLIANEYLEIIDYKDGMTPVEAWQNPQLMHYSMGALADLRAANGTVPVTKVRHTIVQPRMREMGMEGVNSWEIHVNELMGHFHTVIAPAAAATDHPEAPLVPGEVQCKWCRAKGSCKALASTALKEAQILFSTVEIAEQAADKQPNALSDAELAQLIEAKPLLLQLIEGAEAEAKRRLETGQKIEGLKLVRGRGSRAWAFPDMEMEGKLKRMGLPRNVIWKTTMISPAQAAKARWEKKVKGDVQEVCLTERQLKRMEKEYVETSPGKIIVVPVSDKREAIALDAETLFKDVAPTETVPDWMR